ncbi:TetR family transcriptional regulator [Microtetraspora sp. NBRC 13810]|uniref:TetR/AcrR family transcriptional regulator n=1 Tax=Microtetraspora sp. NBRC 13810 TaxID=3030990 RepID=UPI0024A5FD96|nr:helix-turn-helix domain-containing protein [Microtetraspora sp. NBRC 13810]GLW12873.1 TetR family transcriptional regulator [Microtetraspora sp. NBRC 13810]
MPDVRHFDPETVLEQVELLFWQRNAALTGIAEIVATTGLSRSSLYAAFGGKQALYEQALRRYVERRSGPMFDRLAADKRGLPAIADFFERLIQSRCEGDHARWGCMVSNAHAGTESGDPGVRRILDQHQRQLRAALTAALDIARSAGQIRLDLHLDSAAESLALLAYGVNLRSRAGADPAELRAAVAAVLTSLQPLRSDDD